MKTVYFALGTNIGRRKSNLYKALKLIEECGLKIVKKSHIYNTKAISKINQGDFLNMCIEVQTMHGPQKILRATQLVEKQMGREKKGKKRIGYEKPRIIDIDILLVGNEIINKKNLKIPHPRMHKRKFVLEPLSDIAPLIKHPLQHKTVRELLKNLPN